MVLNKFAKRKKGRKEQKQRSGAPQRAGQHCWGPGHRPGHRRDWKGWSML